MFALVQSGTITQVGALPRLYHDGARWWDYRLGQNDPAAQGWLEVQATPRPADTATTTHDWSVTLVGGIPTETWTAREWTVDELAARQAATARAALLEEIGRIDAALAAEDARIQPCLDDGPQTINASPAQYIKHNARALKRVIKAARDLAAVVRDN